MNAPTENQTPTGTRRSWLLLLCSLATWPALYSPVVLRVGDGGIGTFALMAVFWWPGLVFMNSVLFCVALFWGYRARRIVGKIAATLAAIHSAFFVAISVPHILKFVSH